jgi:ADP-heptose:LPS heptosyltransferase
MRRGQKPRKVILKNSLSPGDIVMMTAMVRDLHKAYPRAFRTDVRTSCPALWENNPYITALSEHDRDVEVVQCEYPLIHRSNNEPWHFLHGFMEDVSRKLRVNITPTEFCGDIHVSELERAWMSQVEEITREPTRFWIVNAGGKFDFTAKWWDPRKWQRVVDHFRGDLLFVQVGEAGHHHPPLDGVIDLRGKTDLRQLVRLVFHSDGVCCGVSLPMHLAAAVPSKHRARRPCVVVAGGREPPHWESYPTHHFLHTMGFLPCCAEGGCWKSRVVPIGDGDEKDGHPNLCLLPVTREGHIPQPQCMELITPADVIEKIEHYRRAERYALS